MRNITVRKLRQDIDELLQFKHALGYSYERNKYTLASFLKFALQRFDKHRQKCKTSLDIESALKAWLARGKDRKPISASSELSTIRELCLFIRRRNPSFYVPDHELAPYPVSNFTPYIFTNKEVELLLKSTQCHQAKNISQCTLYTLLLILYCTGLRFGEAVRLRLSDIDFTQKLFIVRESKGRTRYVPFGKDLMQAINVFINERQRIMAASDYADENTLFIRKSGKPLTV